MQYLNIIGIVLCFIGTALLARKIFKYEKKEAQLYIYSREENIERQKKFELQAKRDRTFDSIGFILNALGFTLQLIYLISTK